ncbi:hypothetical protein DFH06DRAFT_1349843 [Mycena polygramma]|nr:hypothetical protein DFH06DRAFT_1349843 [Mycena polygramma]
MSHNAPCSVPAACPRPPPPRRRAHPHPSPPTRASARARVQARAPPPPSNTKLTLVPSSFADADAIVVIPPPGTPHVPGTRPGQGLLLTGPALERLRHPQRQIAKGTRLHPYRFAGRPRVQCAFSVPRMTRTQSCMYRTTHPTCINTPPICIPYFRGLA